jgi:hypothetical protein
MPNNLTANAPAFGKPAAARRPPSSLCHEIGLAAVAIELDLELSTLDHDVAEAIAQGAAALFDAGYGPGPIGLGRSVRAKEKGSRDKVRRRASKAKESRPLPKRKGEIELRHETNAVPAS